MLEDKVIGNLFEKFESSVNGSSKLSGLAKDVLIKCGKVLCHYARNPAGRDEVIEFFESAPKLVKEGKIILLKNRLELELTHYSNSVEHDLSMELHPDSEFYPEGKEEAEEAIAALKEVRGVYSRKRKNISAHGLPELSNFQEQMQSSLKVNYFS